MRLPLSAAILVIAAATPLLVLSGMYGTRRAPENGVSSKIAAPSVMTPSGQAQPQQTQGQSPIIVTMATPITTAKKVRLKAIIVDKAKPIPTRLLSEKEGFDIRWPSTRFVLFYKKGFKTGATMGNEKLIIHKAWYKPWPSSPWSEAPRDLIKKCDFRIVSYGGGENDIPGNVADYVFDDPPPGMWRFDAEVVVNFSPDIFDKPIDGPTPEYEGHARFIAEATTPQSAWVGNPVELHPNWIKHIEWAPTLKDPWKKVPEPGESGFPLHVKQPLDIYLRAVKRYPGEPWPTEGFDALNIGQRLPKWGGHYWNSRIEPDFQSNPRDDVMHLKRSEVSWFDFARVARGEGVVGSSDNEHLLTIIANAGGNKVARLFVEPLPSPKVAPAPP